MVQWNYGIIIIIVLNLNNSKCGSNCTFESSSTVVAHVKLISPWEAFVASSTLLKKRTWLLNMTK